jgi:DNA-binding transcriptional MocR family regulator
MEDPTYPGAIAAFGQAGTQLIGVPVDRNGVVVDELARALETRPALVYLQSTVHSPTGAILTEPRRRRIADLVTAARVPLVEDLALADLA